MTVLETSALPSKVIGSCSYYLTYLCQLPWDRCYSPSKSLCIHTLQEMDVTHIEITKLQSTGYEAYTCGPSDCSLSLVCLNPYKKQIVFLSCVTQFLMSNFFQTTFELLLSLSWSHGHGPWATRAVFFNNWAFHSTIINVSDTCSMNANPAAQTLLLQTHKLHIFA